MADLNPDVPGSTETVPWKKHSAINRTANAVTVNHQSGSIREITKPFKVNRFNMTSPRVRPINRMAR